MSHSVMYTSQNNVNLEYDLRLGDGTRLQGSKSCTSGSSLGVTQQFPRTADTDGEFRHAKDPDAQLFDWLDNKVWEHYDTDPAYRAATGSVTGTVVVRDDQGPCRSCRGVFKAFTKRYPRVDVTIKYKGDKNHPVAAGLGGGQYGYQDAALDGLWWVKRL